MTSTSRETHDRAEAAFRKKERQQAEGRIAMAEYEAARAAEREKTARLRALRLAREAAETASAIKRPVLRPARSG